MLATNKMHQLLRLLIFKSTLHVSGDKFAHPQEHFLTVYTAFGTMHRHCCKPAAVSVHCTKSRIYISGSWFRASYNDN